VLVKYKENVDEKAAFIPDFVPDGNIGAGIRPCANRCNGHCFRHAKHCG
jgi:hypothetical protein